MLRLSRASGRPGLLGVFVAAKKSGQQRLVFDTRVCNARFSPPFCTELPSASAFSRMGTQGCGDTWFSSGDISNAFYAMQVPVGLCEFFALPPVRAGHAGVSQLDDAPVHESELLPPELTILPMGWSWAFHLCQCVSGAVLARACMAPEQQVRDRSLGVRLGPRLPAAGAAYVDKYLVAGCQRARVQAVAQKVERELSSVGFVSHEQVSAARQASFAGLDLDGHERSVRESLRRPLLEIILGHCNWVTLLKRCSLAILDAVYPFTQAAKDKTLPLWPSVRRELWPARSLLLLFVCFADAEWHPEVAKDWNRSFGEVDPNLLVGDGWAVTPSFPRRDACDICRAEGIALGSALWHQLRVSDAFGRRMVCLIDNMSLSLAIGKGRGGSAQQRSVLREICAISLACRLRVVARWAPSELEPPGGPSRGLPCIKRVDLYVAAGHACGGGCPPARGAAGGLQLGITYFEQMSIGKGTLLDHQWKVSSFVKCCLDLRQDWSSWAQLDLAVVACVDYLYFHGRSGGDASLLLAAFNFCLPPIGRWGGLMLCQAPSSLAGRGKCAPRRMRMPIPWLAVGAIAGVGLTQWQFEQTIAMILSVACFFRSSECDLLTAAQVALPVGEGGGALGVAALLLYPNELGHKGRTGLWDFAVGPVTCAFLASALLGLKQRASTPSARPRIFPPGAPPVQQCGGWTSDNSFRRYVEQAHIIAKLQRAGTRAIDHGRQLDGQPPTTFLSGAVAVASARLTSTVMLWGLFELLRPGALATVVLTTAGHAAAAGRMPTASLVAVTSSFPLPVMAFSALRLGGARTRCGLGAEYIADHGRAKRAKTDPDTARQAATLGVPLFDEDRDIREYFATFGAIKEAFVSLEKDTTISRCFASLRFFDDAAAEKVLAGKHEIWGHEITLSEEPPNAEERPEFHGPATSAEPEEAFSGDPVLFYAMGLTEGLVEGLGVGRAVGGGGHSGRG
ncbi:unnamed protein product [Prorocentrum cordatum]|uniref:RRM domain-containing protein n=1 Tax=Prorocentrum cordatum TaxID=2364126 RepID=A0ABN9W6S9_9DINO|nr:unnamed protein product [Polarella glacialis]